MNHQRIVQIISNLFHPLLSLTWATVFLMLFSPLKVLPVYYRLVFVGEVAVMSFVMPCLLIILMAKTGIVKNGVALRDRSDRILPLSAYMMFCFIQVNVLSRQGMPDWALFLYWGGAVMSVCFVVITVWWKISGHAAGNTCLATGALILYYLFPQVVPLFVPLLLIIITGGVSSIRLYLGRHTPAQIAAGTALGLACMVGAFLVLGQ